MPHMTKKEAFDMVDGVLAQIKFNRFETMQLMEAMKVLLGAPEEPAKLTEVKKSNG